MSLNSSRTPEKSGRALVFLGLYWAAAFLLTHLPVPEIPPPPIPYLDKAIHVTLYAGLAWLWVPVLASRYHSISLYRAVLILVMVYAIFDETTQPLVGRTCDVLDGLADFAGAVIGCSLRQLGVSVCAGGQNPHVAGADSPELRD